jgi:hypothetical protein
VDTELIKSFLVGLGFGVDDASLSKFNKALASATLKVTALYAATQAMATGIAFGIAKISEGFEQIGYEYRLIAPAVNKALILRQALFKAYSEAGVNLVKVIQSSIKLNYSLTKTRFAFEAIYKSVAAKFFPLLTKQSDIFREKLFKNMPKIQAILERFIFVIFKAFDATVQLAERIWSVLTRVYDFFYKLHKETDGWSTVIIAAIAAWKLLNLAFLATPLGLLISGFTALLLLWDDLQTFAEGGQSLINWGSDVTKMIVGMITAAGAATIAYYAWGAAVGFLTPLLAALDGGLTLTEALLAVLDTELTAAAIATAILEAPIWLIVAAVTALIAALIAVDSKWQIFGGHLSGFFSGIGGKVLSFLTGSNNLVNGVQNASGFFSQPNPSSNLQSPGGGVPASLANPVGSGAQNSQNSRHLQQETNINIMGSADASSVGKAVAGEQTSVNRDMARNLFSPTGPG